MLILGFNYDKVSEAENEEVNFWGESGIINVMNLMEYEGDENMFCDYLGKCVLFVHVHFYLSVYFYNLIKK